MSHIQNRVCHLDLINTQQSATTAAMNTRNTKTNKPVDSDRAVKCVEGQMRLGVMMSLTHKLL